MTRPLTIGTRGSLLALWQSRHIAQCLRDVGVPQVELQIIKTTGDRITDRHPSQISEKGIFVKEIEEALLAKTVDLAVHSTKDLPGVLPAGLTLGAHPERVDPRDALITRDGVSLDNLPQGAVLGTVSLRRRAQLLARRPDLQFTDMRGNVDTRLRKMEEGEVDGIVLAYAGLRRLELADHRCWPVPVEICLPAPGQGVLGIECREEDQEVLEALAMLEDTGARQEVTAERKVLSQLDAGCLVPLAALGRVKEGNLTVDGLVARPDGSEIIKERCEGAAADAEKVGLQVADALRARGAVELLAEARSGASGQTAADE